LLIGYGAVPLAETPLRVDTFGPIPLIVVAISWLRLATV
jgi:hypothetical protein